MREFDRCPRCNQDLIPALSYLGTESTYWKECTHCNTFVNTYVPQPHQEAVHRDTHTYIGNFGGYGTGKTLTSTQEVFKHLCITPHANILISANIAAQYEQTIKRDIEQEIPAKFVKYVSAQKSYMDLINGARIIYRPLDDPDKLRSLNLTMFVIVEASETHPEAMVQLKTRLRNLAASVPVLGEDDKPIMEQDPTTGVTKTVVKAEWTKGIIESNPDSGWVKSDILMVSDVINRHGRVVEDAQVEKKKRDIFTSSHIASTDCNAYLPPDFIQKMCMNKPIWWVNRFILGSFSFAEGLVYPSAKLCVVERFEVPQHWKRIIAADYGLSDNFVYLYGAIDEQNGIVYIYKEFITNNMNVEELSRIYHQESADIPSGGLYCAPLLDPKSGAKRDYNKKTLYDHFLDYGISFQPGHIQVDARVIRTNTYLESGKLKIMSNCEYLIGELDEYKFPPKTLNGALSRKADKPMDKNNHAINPLEWICMALPSNPRNILYGIFDSSGRDLTKLGDKRDIWLPWSLRGNDDSNSYDEVYESEVF